MTDEYGFALSGVGEANLDELSLRSSHIDEARIYELEDLAREAAELTASTLLSDLGISGALSVLADTLSFGSYPAAEDTPLGLCLCEGRARLLTALDRARFATSYLAALSELGCKPTEADFLGESERGERFAYVKNQFSDEAYDVLSADCTDPRVRYYKSFRECAAALAGGECDRILLPLEERGGVRLPTVSELIYRYDFKINSVTPVFGLGGDADLKYAEISRHFRHHYRTAEDDGYLELRLPGASASLAELMTVAELYGMSVYRLNTHTLDSEGESITYISIVLREGASDFSPMLTYLALFAEDSVPVGIYKNIE